MGLAAMHTMGHSGMGHGSETMAQASMMPEAVSDSQVMSDIVDGLTLAAALPGAEHPADFWAVCVAVLGGTALLLLFGSALARRARPARCGRTGSFGVPAAPRAPPPRLGLRLVNLSVVRR